MGNPGKEHWQVVKHILRYFKGTTNIVLVYHGDISCVLVGYLDFGYVVDLDARRSMTRDTFIISNSLVSWKATL